MSFQQTRIIISDLLLDETIYNAVISMNAEFSYKVHRLTSPLLPLTRSRLLSALQIEDLDTLPVRVSYSEEHGKYVILDGRHRISSAIIKGILFIPIETEENTTRNKCESCGKKSNVYQKSLEGEIMCQKCYNEHCCCVCHSWSGSNDVCCD